MSKLEELIQKYCPDGVEWHPFFDVCDLIRGITYNKEQEAKTQTEDAHKVLRANNITLHLNALNFEDVKLVSRDVVVKPAQHLFAGDILMCAGSGSKEHVGKVAFIPVDMDYTFGGFMAVVRCKKTILPRFVYHILTSGYFSDHLEVQINSSTINNINKQVMQSFELPVPPLPVQEEIVRVLDTFTKLQAELQAELQKRLQQYNYYRDNLLSFDGEHNLLWGLIKQHCPDGVEYHKVKDVYKRLKGTPITAGKMKEIKTPGGAIRVFAGGKTVIDANEEDIPNANITRVPAVLVQSRGVIDAVYYDKPFTFKNEMWAYTAQDIPAVKYLYYVLKANIQTFRDAASGMGSLPQISLGVTEDYIIPVPPLPVQQKIVDILDRFDILTTDLTAGLPAEIEKRKQQYEFYRDKLLTFKRKEAKIWQRKNRKVSSTS